MKFQVQRDVLAEAVSWVARSLPLRPPIPVLAGVKLEASDGSLKLSSFDYEVSARYEVEADVLEDGEVLVSGRLLAEIAKALPNYPVDVELDGAKVSLVCGSSRFNLMSMSIDEYPALPEVPEAIGAVDANEFSTAINQVTLAAAKGEMLPFLASVHFEIQGDTIVMMATDRYRLAQRRVTWTPADSTYEATVLIKSKVLSDMAKSFPNVGSVSLSLVDGKSEGESAGQSIYAMSMMGRQMTSQLTEADYPDLQKLFPDSTPITATMNRKEMIEALKRMRLVADKGGRVSLVFTPDSLVMDAGEGPEAQASEEISCQLVGDSITATYNPDYLLEGLEVIPEEYVQMGFVSAEKAAMLVGQEEIDGPTNMNYRYLVMPRRFGS